MKSIVIEADGTVSLRNITTLDDMQATVGGDVQLLPFGKDCNAYINEHGKGIGLPPNDRATGECLRHGVGLAPDDWIAGTMFILGPLNKNGNDTDVPQSMINNFGMGHRLYRNRYMLEGYIHNWHVETTKQYAISTFKLTDAEQKWLSEAHTRHHRDGTSCRDEANSFLEKT
jgi:hypothetical protein